MTKSFCFSARPFSVSTIRWIIVSRGSSPRFAPTASRLRPQRCRSLTSTSNGLLAQPYNAAPGELWFTPSAVSQLSRTSSRGVEGPNSSNGDADGDHKPPDERVLKLGKTLRILSPLLPTILINPLPVEILSPQITLHLFPSTHPHLPTVKGRTLYRAALWTVPVAWSSLPLVGNVKLKILSERMIRANSVLGCDHIGECGEERLVVRWKTEGSSTSTSSESELSSTDSRNLAKSKAGTNKGFSTLLGGDAPIFKLGKEGQFNGLFIFAFDEKGRIASHTIEHADQADGWDRTSKFVTLTDWLLGKARGSIDPSPEPSLAAHACEDFKFDHNLRFTRDRINGYRVSEDHTNRRH